MLDAGIMNIKNVNNEILNKSMIQKIQNVKERRIKC